jgi:hypothetical protein
MERKAIKADWSYQCPVCKGTVIKGSPAVEEWASRGRAWERTVAHPECRNPEKSNP